MQAFSYLTQHIGGLLTMRNISNKSCRENQNKKIMFSSFFSPKIVAFMRKRRKMWGQRRHKLQYGGYARHGG